MANAFEPTHFILSTVGNQFQAANTDELLTRSFNVRTVIRCAMLCHGNMRCRTFDFDSDSQECRLFEGSIDTGTLLSVPSSTVIGSIIINRSVYNLYNTSSDHWVNNRFLDSNIFSGLCQCPLHTFWNESMCVNQRYAGKGCLNDKWCRTDLNISCVSLVCIVNNGSLSTSSSTETTTSTTTTSTSSSAKTTSTTTTTSTSSSTETTISTTTTSTSSSTETTTSTTTTSTSSSTETTTSTTTTSTSSSTETTTSTTTTSTSSSTETTTSTTTASTSVTTLSTVVPSCIPQPVSNGTLLYIANPTSSIYPTYTCYAYTWTATGSSATLSFFFRHDPGAWMLDDVSVYLGSTQTIINGGFETGDLTGWTRSGTCAYNIGQAYSGSAYAKSGNWYYYDLCAGNDYGDTLSQTFSTVAGNTYNISFWLTNLLLL